MKNANNKLNEVFKNSTSGTREEKSMQNSKDKTYNFEGVKQGERNSTAIRLVGILIHDKIPIAAAFIIMEKWNQTNSPPLEENELSDLIERAYENYSQELGTEVISNEIKEGIELSDLLVKDIPPPDWIVQGIISSGLTFIAAPPKTGKSFLGQNLAIAVANGDLFLDSFQTIQTNTIFISNEDSEYRLQQRFKKMNQWDNTEKSIHIHTEFPIINEEVFHQLKSLVIEKKIGLIIIDIFGKAIKYPNVNGYSYFMENNLVGMFQKFAHENKLALILVHHTRKAAAENSVEKILGSQAIAGSGDTIIILDKKSNKTFFEAFGKDIGYIKFEIEFDKETYTWKKKESEEKESISPEKQEIIDLLKFEDIPMKTSEISESLDKPLSTISKHLRELLDLNLILNPKTGYYSAIKKKKAISKIVKKKAIPREDSKSNENSKSIAKPIPKKLKAIPKRSSKRGKYSESIDNRIPKGKKAIPKQR